MVIGNSCAECFDDMYFLERTAQNQILALSAVGGNINKLRLIKDDVVNITNKSLESVRVEYAIKHFNSLVQKEAKYRK